MGQSWTIIIFLYNEEGTIASVIQDCLCVLSHISNSQYEIIVINDGSEDKSDAVIKEVIKGHPNIRYECFLQNKGIGAALVKGYELASCENICAIPGDAQFNPNELKSIPVFSDGNFISFYRKKTNYNYYRSALSKFNRWFNRVVLNLDLKDVNWIKVYKRAQLENLDLKLKSSLIESEICAKLVVQEIVPLEILSEYRDRKSGHPKGGSFKTIMKALSETILIWRLISGFRRRYKTFQSK